MRNWERGVDGGQYPVNIVYEWTQSPAKVDITEVIIERMPEGNREIQVYYYIFTVGVIIAFTGT